jgi:hypothetical protein
MTPPTATPLRSTTTGPQKPSIPVGVPFGINFAVPCLSAASAAQTNTVTMSDDDTGTWRNDTEDKDT